MLEQLRRLFGYDIWANRETLASLEAAGPAVPAVAVKRMGHVLGTEWLWFSRLTGEEKSMVVWPPLTVADCRRETGRLEAAWREHLAGLTEEALSRAVSYVNSKGEPWKSAAGDILMHTVMHSAYHRGQVASDLRTAGFEPAYTDFIHGVRKGFVRALGEG
ncbi:MAG TPA: DinB family protein [Thermoanaerobaculia bacterium]|nr:DinB family protein [Thermoanaerobaculia bacterium]